MTSCADDPYCPVERNFYLHGFTLFLSLILSRTVRLTYSSLPSC